MPRGHAFAEKLRGQLGQLVRLVEDEGGGARQDLAEALALDREVGEQQVVVHDHEVGGLRLRARLRDEAFRPERAIPAQAVFRGRGHARQQRAVVAQVLQLGQVATLRAPAPRHHSLEERRVLAAGEALALGLLHAVMAEVVGATLEQRRADRRAQRLANPRQVAVVQLVLQRARAGGHDHALPGKQRGHQVGVGLAGAGARLGDERGASLDRVGDRGRKFGLRSAHDIAGQAQGKFAPGGQGRATAFAEGGHARAQ